jgi:hypothetical protein
MKCDTCKQESPVVMRVVIAKGYNRSLARPLFNCPSCFERKEDTKQRSRLEARSPYPEPPAKEKR